MCKDTVVSEEHPMVECPECGQMAPPIERCLHCNTDFRALGLDRSGDFTSAEAAVSGELVAVESDPEVERTGSDRVVAVFETDDDPPLPDWLDSSQPGDLSDEAVEESAGPPTKAPADPEKIWEEVFNDDTGPPNFFERHSRLIWIALVVMIVGGAIIAALVVMTPSLEESGDAPPLGDIPGYNFVGD